MEGLVYHRLYEVVRKLGKAGRAVILFFHALRKWGVGSFRENLRSGSAYFFLAPVRAMLLIANGERPDFSAISRSCSMM